MNQPQFEPLSQPLVDLIDEILAKEDAKISKTSFYKQLSSMKLWLLN
jgi:hypothetical protein